MVSRRRLAGSVAGAALVLASAFLAHARPPQKLDGQRGSGPRRLFESIAPSAGLPAFPTGDLRPFQRRARFGRPSLPVLRETAAELQAEPSGDQPLLQLNLFDDAVFEIAMDRIETRAANRFTLFGRVPGVEGSRVILVSENESIAAMVSMPLATYQIRPAPGRLHVIEELDDTGFPDEIPPIPVASPSVPVGDAPTRPDDGSNIDVLVLYTVRAMDAAGDTSAITALIELSVANTNASYAASGVSQRLRLVHSAETAYAESGDMSLDLSRLRATSDGYLDEAHTLRETHHADLVSLLVESGGYCGVAYLMTNVSTAFASDAFSVVAQSCAAGNLSFAHELGHNMGLTHDPANAGGQGAYPYAYGYQDPEGQFRTVMAYAEGCPPPCTRVMHFSNPSVLYSGRATGVTDAQDNARALNQTAPTVASFRAEAPAGPPAAFGKSLPSSGATAQSRAATLSWAASSGATSYSVCVDSTDDSSCDGNNFIDVGSATSWRVTGQHPSGLSADTTYYWQVRAGNLSGTTEANSGTWWSFTTGSESVANDRCDQAVTAALPYEDQTDTTLATVDVSDPTPQAGNNERARSVWYRFTAPRGGRVLVTTVGSSYDAILSAWTGSCGQGTLAGVTDGANDDFFGLAARIAIRVTAGETYWIMVSSYSGIGGALQLHMRWVPSDFDGDGRADLGVFRQGTWFVAESSAGFATSKSWQWGTSGDVPVPGDYDGDAKTDLAVFRPSSGTWFVSYSASGYETSMSRPWGGSRDVPVPGDYDGDGKCDLAVYRPSSGTWFVSESSTGFATGQSWRWGKTGDVAVPADFDGDGRMDLAVFRPSVGTWFVKTSASEYTTGPSWRWGASGDLPAPGDYDGDGKADLVVFRPSSGTWFVSDSSTSYATTRSWQWGTSGDVPLPADHDGDGIAELGVFRSSSGMWFLGRSSTSFVAAWTLPWGAPGDTPLRVR